MRTSAKKKTKEKNSLKNKNCSTFFKVTITQKRQAAAQKKSFSRV